jgi:hypothetical protein
MAAPLLLNQMLLQAPRLINALAKRATTETVRRAQRALGPTRLPQDPPALLVALVLPQQKKPLAGAWLTSTEMPLLPLLHALLVLMAAPLLLNQMLLQAPRLINALAKRATTETVRRAQRALGPTRLPQDPPALLVALVLPQQKKPLAGAWLTSTEMPLLPLLHALLVLMAAPLLLNQMLIQPPWLINALA